MTLSKEQWNKVLKDIIYYPGFSKLKIDSYNVTLQRVHDTANPLKNVIMVFVNGTFKGSFITSDEPSDVEMRKRFYCPSKASGCSVSSLRKKGWYKRDAEKFVKDLTRTIYLPYWSSFNALKRHLLANNKDISLVEELKLGKGETRE